MSTSNQGSLNKIGDALHQMDENIVSAIEISRAAIAQELNEAAGHFTHDWSSYAVSNDPRIVALNDLRIIPSIEEHYSGGHNGPGESHRYPVPSDRVNAALDRLIPGTLHSVHDTIKELKQNLPEHLDVLLAGKSAQQKIITGQANQLVENFTNAVANAALPLMEQKKKAIESFIAQGQYPDAAKKDLKAALTSVEKAQQYAKKASDKNII